MEKIDLDQLNGTISSIERISSTIINYLEHDNELFDTNRDKLVFNAVSYFNFPTISIELEKIDTVRHACLEILKRAEIYDTDGKPYPNFNLRGNEIIDHFLSEILNFSRLPGKVFIDLNKQVKEDLKEVNDLIDEYNTSEEIKAFKNTNQHQRRIVEDFLNRCLDQRQIIEEYLNNGIRDRALAKSLKQDDISSISAIINVTDPFRDRPYLWAWPTSISYFDYRQIDESNHRIQRTLVSDGIDYNQLYKENKKTFYKELSKSHSPDQIFSGIETYYSKRLAEVNERTQIFEELKWLFSHQRWIAFCALAIVQIEGLFADMIKSMRENVVGALPDKVDIVSPRYYLADAYFDYYKYISPILRNRFTHYGQIPGHEYDIMALDLLYDIDHLLSVFETLDNPHVWLNKVLKYNDINFIDGLESYNKLFNSYHTVIQELQLERSDPRKKNAASIRLEEVKRQWAEYEKNYLTTSGDLEHYAQILLNDFGDTLNQLFDEIDYFNTKYVGKTLKLSNMNMLDVFSLKDPIAKDVSKYFPLIRDKFQYVTEISNFLSHYKKYLLNCPTVASESFDRIRDLYKIELRKLRLIGEELVRQAVID